MVSSRELTRAVNGFILALVVFVGLLLAGSYLLGATCGL
jgi:hypothetical protein